LTKGARRSSVAIVNGNTLEPELFIGGLAEGVVVRWEMMVADSECKVASGLAILIVDSEGRIRTDYQFVTERAPLST
jgi:hypothetical protein